MQEWYVHENGATTGPFSTDAVKEAIKAGKIGAQATFCVTGTTSWRPIGELPELAAAQPTELPMAAAKCGACSCPIARNFKKIVAVAILAAVAWTGWCKYHGTCPLSFLKHKQPAQQVQPL
jgi:hypothetical protein